MPVKEEGMHFENERSTNNDENFLRHNEKIMKENGFVHCAYCQNMIHKSDKYCAYCGKLRE